MIRAKAYLAGIIYRGGNWRKHSRPKLRVQEAVSCTLQYKQGQTVHKLQIVIYLYR